MNLTREKIELLVKHHINELLPMLPPLAGRCEDYDAVIFLNRHDNTILPEYLSMLSETVTELAGAITAYLEIDDPEPDVQKDELDEEDLDRDTEAMDRFLSEVPFCCAEFLRQAHLALQIEEEQEAFYRLGFVSACTKAFELFAEEDCDRACARTIATAWAYIPYVDAVFDNPYLDSEDEERMIGDAVFILGLIHGSLWFSFTDFPIDDLMNLLEKLPSVQ